MSLLKVELKKRVSPRFSLDVLFQVASGVTVLFGPSGSGKTSVLDCIAGLAAPDAGSITLDEEVFFASEPKRNLTTAQRRLGYVFQSPALFPHMTVLENVKFGIQERRESHAVDLLERLKISHLSSQKPNQLSGGEKQRVSLARTLVTAPKAVLLDEPFSGLDDEIKFDLIHDLLAWNSECTVPILYVTHALEETFLLGANVIVMKDGKIAKEGSPHDVLQEEKQRLVAALA